MPPSLETLARRSAGRCTKAYPFGIAAHHLIALGQEIARGHGTMATAIRGWVRQGLRLRQGWICIRSLEGQSPLPVVVDRRARYGLAFRETFHLSLFTADVD
jgi:hypothetical protein